MMLIYGKAATGKTTYCLMKVHEFVKDNKRVAFIDTEKSFSVERFGQMCCCDLDGCLNRIIFMKANGFMEQCSAIDGLWEIRNRIKLIVVDSLTGLYRKELHENEGINPLLVKQLSMLKEIEKKGEIQVILTSQIYSDADGMSQCIGGGILKKWCENVARLESEGKKRLWVDETKNEKRLFRIEDRGIIF
ncbi:AAA family ATPase [archaeon]|nr:AAA family ATPase [archaeon]